MTEKTDLFSLNKWKELCDYSQGRLNRLFLHFEKKLKPKKTQNSRKILKNSSKISKKTQKLATPVELNWC